MKKRRLLCWVGGIYGFFSFQPFVFGGWFRRPSTSKAGTATAPPNLRDPQLEDAMLREVTGVFFSPYINTFFVGSQI